MDLAGQLRELHELHSRGALTEDEFKAAKATLLSGGDASAAQQSGSSEPVLTLSDIGLEVFDRLSVGEQVLLLEVRGDNADLVIEVELEGSAGRHELPAIHGFSWLAVDCLQTSLSARQLRESIGIRSVDGVIGELEEHGFLDPVGEEDRDYVSAGSHIPRSRQYRLRDGLPAPLLAFAAWVAQSAQDRAAEEERERTLQEQRAETEARFAKATPAEADFGPSGQAPARTRAPGTPTPVDELSTWRRAPEGDLITGCLACGHEFLLPGATLNAWLETRSLGGKLGRAGRRMQHTGNVLTPGIGWMLSGRSARRVQADIADLQAVAQAVACPSCRSQRIGVYQK